MDSDGGQGEKGSPTDEVEIKLATEVAAAKEVERAKSKFRREFKATEVDISSFDDEVSATLRFEGFTSLGAAMERIAEVAGQLENLRATADVSLNVDTRGTYDHDGEGREGRPCGQVTAHFDVCTCGPNEACDECGGRR